MRKTIIASLVLAIALAVVAVAQTVPATQPAPTSSQPTAEQLLKDMLKPQTGIAKPLQATPDTPAIDNKSGTRNSIAPNSPPIALQREGTFIFDRTGRLTHSPDGSQAEFTFESDGKTMKDPPVIILPNLKLMTMEDVVKATNRDLRFRVSGMLTEYRGRNYLLLEKVLVPPEGNAQF
jgi:hypothetical protein